MLILPLHRPLTRATFPLLTALIVAINVFVFVFLQSGDDEHRARASEYYVDSGMAELEAAPFDRYLAGDTGAELRAVLDEVPDEIRPEVASALAQQDPGFRAALAGDALFASAESRSAWQALAARHDELVGRIFTDRWALDAQDPGIATLLSSMFLHGGIDHLFGNMLFLIALGLLVERPLGAPLFGVLYLLAGAGAGLAWLALQRGEPGSVIGASGAIAGLMGAFCVVWGLRRVRFFYWFFVVFDYVRAPALVLLPLWLGWELLQMGIGGGRVAYSAHAGGIVSGALLAWLATRMRWHDAGWLDAEDASAPADIDTRFQRARQHLGRMELDACERLLAELATLAPQRADIALLRLRCARYAGDRQRGRAQLLALLDGRALAAAELRELAQLQPEIDLADWRAVAPAQRNVLAGRFAGIGEITPAFALLELDVDNPAAADALPRGWLQLAFRLRDAGHAEPMRRALQRLVERHPASAEAGKARFLLQEEPAAPTPLR